MRKLKNLYERFKLGLLFVVVPTGSFAIGDILYYYLPHISPFSIMAYGMQIGAFIVFMRRVNLIYMFNHPQNKSIWEAIKISVSPPVVEGGVDVTLKNASRTINATGSAQVETIKVGDVQEMLLAHDKRLNQLESSVDKLPTLMHEKSNEVEKALRDEITAFKKKKKQEKKRELDFAKDNAGPEFVAVLWLILAALTFAVTHIIG